VRDADSMSRALDGIDGVCHLAAKVGLGVDLQDLPDYADANVNGTAVLLAAMAREGVGRLALAASMVAYGEGRGVCADHGSMMPGPRSNSDLADGRFDPTCPKCGDSLTPQLMDESAPVDPRNAYAASKVAQEHLAAAWSRGADGTATALRYHNVYGPGMPRDTPYAGVAAIFVSELRAGRSPRVFEDGRQRRDFVHVDDVARATVTALEKADAPFTVFNVGSGTPRTVGDVAVELANAVGGPLPVVTGEYRLGDVRHITADSSKLRNELNWRPSIEFADGMQELGGRDLSAVA
jgi:dTDP-L-rhamnose 4-epimerase